MGGDGRVRVPRRGAQSRLALRTGGVLLAGMVAGWIGYPAHAGEGFLVVRAKQVITGAGADVARGTVVIEGDRVRLVGDQGVEVPPGSREVDATQEWVTPGFVLARTRYSLPRYERSGNQSHRSASIEIYPDEIEFSELIERGFTTVAFYPEGAGIPGRVAVVRTAARTGEPSFVGDSYLRVRMTNPAADKGVLSTSLAKAKEQIAKIAKAREEWEKKQVSPKPSEGEAKPKEGEQRAGQDPSAAPTEGAASPERSKTVFVPPATDERYRFFMDLLEKKPGQRIGFELSRAGDLVHLEDVLSEYPEVSIDRLYFTPNLRPDYLQVIDRLKERRPKVVLAPRIFQMPDTVTRFDLVAELIEAGCEVSFVPDSDRPSDFLALRAGVADLVRLGLSPTTAIAGLTSNPARFLEIEDRYGSLEKGKMADLVFWDANPLDPASRVTRVMVSGSIVWERGRP